MILDTDPIINPDNVNIQLTGSTIIDEDKDIELKIDSNVNTNVAGEYKVLNSATDSKGKTSRAQSKVTVNPKSTVINKAPVIITEDKVIKVGDKFDPKVGVSAIDGDGVDITSNIKVEGSVDTSKAGEYKLIYTVEDKDGNISTFTRIVVVKEVDKLINENNNTPETGDSSVLGYVGTFAISLGGLLFIRKKTKII